MVSPQLRPNVVPVRPVGRPEPPGPPSGWVIAVLTGLAGLAGGYLIGAGTVPSPVLPQVEEIPAPTVVQATIEPEEGLAEPREVDGVALIERVPGFRYTLHMSGWAQSPDGSLESRAWTWPHLSEDPSATAMGPGTGQLTFDPSGRWLASLSGDHSTLRAGDVDEVAWLMDGVRSYAWKAGAEGELAWIEQRMPGQAPILHTGTVAGDGVYFRPVTTLEEFEYAFDRGTWEGPELVHYDDTVFVFQSTDRSIGPRVYSFDPAGSLLGASDGIFLGSGRGGAIGMLVDGEARVRIVDGSLGSAHGLGAAPLGSISWSDDGTAIAMVEATDTDTVALSLWSTDGRYWSIDLNTFWAEVEAWSPDGRFVVLTGGRRPGRQVAVFVDIALGDVHYLQTGFTVQHVVVTSS